MGDSERPWQAPSGAATPASCCTWIVLFVCCLQMRVYCSMIMPCIGSRGSPVMQGSGWSIATLTSQQATSVHTEAAQTYTRVGALLDDPA